MFRTLRPFFITLAFSYLALVVAAETYSHQAPSSTWLFAGALPAFLLEATFFLAATFEDTRAAFARIASPARQAGLLWASALLPYLVFSWSGRTFELRAFAFLAALTGLFSFWNVVAPRRIAYDVGFLFLAAAPMVSHLFPRIYRSPPGQPRLDILGHMMWFRIGIVALLVIREWNPGPFSLWPRWREWRIGVFCYLACVLPISGLAVGVGDVRFAPHQGSTMFLAGLALGTFFGSLWGVALGEDLFFQGVVTKAALRAWRSPVAAVVLSSVLFGAAHLWFHEFPNWRRAVVVILLGLSCGVAYIRSGSVRAPMVTHAFVVTTWRLLFQQVS